MSRREGKGGRGRDAGREGEVGENERRLLAHAAWIISYGIVIPQILASNSQSVSALVFPELLLLLLSMNVAHQLKARRLWKNSMEGHEPEACNQDTAHAAAA